MITTNFYLDTRAVAKGSPAPLKISIFKEGKTAYIPLGVYLLPTQWDKIGKRILAHPRKAFLNSYIQQKKLDVEEASLFLMKSKGTASLPISKIKEEIIAYLNPEEKPTESFTERLRKYAEESNPRTKAIYLATLKRILAFDKAADSLSFEDITEEWLNRFDDFLSRTSPAVNARNIHFRNIRAVFNQAKRNRVTSAYPFERGRFEIRAAPTRKRSLNVEVLRKIISAELEPWQEKYRNMFILTFLLIGINFVDLFNLSAVEEGRVEYIRAKTKRPYSIKVEPEAMDIIRRYEGKNKLLFLADHSSDYRISYNGLCKGLKSIKEKLGLPELSTYWARHSWATIASSLDIPRDTIAQALGHGGNTVTDIYINYDVRKVDEANRKVIDFVFYGKK